ncbi:hypothetical protein ILYODFUR_024536 [Ilyodon furcidens]|uniref:Uncharacterized protein n=1 Tax=Ilyodon furcidens TaxID=33524 RepID=A0ABV0U0A2_9TELE
MKSLCLFASKKTLARCLPYPGPAEEQWKRSDHWKGGGFIRPVTSWEIHCYSLLGCDGSRVNAVYFESSRKVCTGLSRCNHGCSPNNYKPIFHALNKLQATVRTIILKPARRKSMLNESHKKSNLK